MAIAVTRRYCQEISCSACSAVVGKQYVTQLPRHSLARDNFCLDVNSMNRQVRRCHSLGNLRLLHLHYNQHNLCGMGEGILSLVHRDCNIVSEFAGC